jgi:hypothetical protein
MASTNALESYSWRSMEPPQLAAVVVIASMLSVELDISVARLELGLGVVAGNVFGLGPNTDFRPTTPRPTAAT